MRPSGFGFVELLVATAITLVLAAGLLAVAAGGPAEVNGRSAGIEIQERLRAAAEAILADVAPAGSGPVSAGAQRPLGGAVATVLPFRIGPAGDPPGTARTDALTLLASAAAAARPSLVAPWSPASGTATLAGGPGCPAGDPACGLVVGDVVLLLDETGQADCFRVDAVAGGMLALSPRGVTSGREFPAGSPVVPLSIANYWFKPGAPGEAGQLMSGTGSGADMPLIDHVVAASFTLLADPRPPELLPGAVPPVADYGPSPPQVGVDNARDSWPAGENCTFVVSGVSQVSRMPVIGPATGLVPLPIAALTDGPWCPDGSSPGRFDADLLRVRAVRVVVRVEASRREARGANSVLFAHPGSSSDRSASAADREVAFEIVPRALLAGR